MREKNRVPDRQYRQGTLFLLFFFFFCFNGALSPRLLCHFSP